MIRLSLIVIALCGLLGCTSGEEMVGSRRSADERGDYAKALQSHRQAAAWGDANAQYNLGVMYEQGLGVTRDLAEAGRWYAKAAETYPPGRQRDEAIQARERVVNLLVYTPYVPAAQPASVTPPAPIAASPVSPPVAASSPHQTQYRRALLIGNAAYADAPLRNPVNDATDMADILRRVGFEVTLLRNADKLTMEQAIEAFTRGVPRGSIGLFFFSGHGAQIDGLNYLIPIGARLNESIDVRYRAVPADWILGRMDETGMEMKLLVLDACRNNPFGRSWTRALDRGLAVMDAPKGTLIAYATSPKKTALDGTGRNSPYTARLLREVPIPGRPIELVFKAVRLGVQQETQGAQTPWEASSLTGEFYFAR